MYKLAVDLRMLNSSGIGVYLQSLLPELVQHLDQVQSTYMIRSDDRHLFQQLLPDYPFTIFDAPIYSISEQISIRKHLKNTDALWAPHYNAPLYSPVPVIATLHDFAHLALPDIFGKGLKRTYAKTVMGHLIHHAAGLITISEFTQHEMHRFFGAPNCLHTTIHNGISSKWLTRESSPKPHPVDYFIAIGNLKAHKNISMLIDAFHQSNFSKPVDLLLTGQSKGFKAGQISIESSDISGRVNHLGHLPSAELRNYVQHAIALVFPSRYEGFGFPPLEAMAIGVPAITSDIPVIKETCQGHSLTFPCGNTQALSQLMTETSLLADEERNLIITGAKEHASRFQWSSTAKAYASFIHQVLTTHSPKA